LQEIAPQDVAIHAKVFFLRHDAACPIDSVRKNYSAFWYGRAISGKIDASRGRIRMNLSGPFLSGVVTLLAVIVYLYMGARVGILRGRLGIKAPATTGDPLFERAYRVHCNTGEQYIAFLPLLWLATSFFHAIAWLPALFGLAFIVARIVYMQLYMAEPEKRVIGAFMTMISDVGLIVLSVIGLIQSVT